jgi:hypothetical protein
LTIQVFQTHVGIKFPNKNIPNTSRYKASDFTGGGVGEAVENTSRYKASDFTGGGIGEAVEVDGVLWGQRRWRAPGEVVEVDSMLQGRRWWRALGEAVKVDDMLRGQRRRHASGEAVEVEGEAIERRRGHAPLVAACSGHWRRRRPKAREWQNFANCGAGHVRT